MAEEQTPANECLCGRSSTRPHCPACGSYETYAYSAPIVAIRQGGRRVKIKAFRCTICGTRFNDDDWQLNCHAPTHRRAGRPRKLLVRVNSEEERIRLLAHLQHIQKLKDLS